MSGNVLVRDVMTRKVKVVRQDTTLHEVVATFGSFEIGSLVVMEGHRPVGIITTKDALTRGFDHGLPGSAVTATMIASSPLTTIDELAPIEQAVAAMRRNKIKHLPVVNDGRLVGIVSDSDIMFAVPSMIGQMEEVCRPHRQAATPIQ
jgi:CBS domain-containing protein